MSGAELQGMGQVRNAYPYATTTGIAVALTVPTNVFRGEVDITVDKTDIPFDLGPDKSSRVFMVFRNVQALIKCDVGNTTVLSGTLYYRLFGRFYYLSSIVQTLSTTNIAFNVSDMFCPMQSINAESVPNIGVFGFLDNGSVVGTAANVTVALKANVGLYGDYATPDWERLFKTTMHEHIGPMDIARYEQ